MSDYDPAFVPVKNYFLLGVKLILVNKRDEILLLKRSRNLSRPLGWDFPGGGVDKGENFETATIRELYEETGIQIDSLELLGSELADDNGEAVIVGAYATTNHTEVCLSWEHEIYEWLTLDEVDSLELPPLHAKLFESYKNKKFRF